MERRAVNPSQTVAKVACQDVLFAEVPRRSELLRVKPDWPCRDVRVRVWRNTPFEFISSVVAPFAAFADLRVEFLFSDYDDSLSVPVAPGPPSDLEVVWLDFAAYGGRLGEDALLAWLQGRLEAIRGVSDAPILVADSDMTDAIRFNAALNALAGTLAGVRVFERSAVAASLGPAYRDARLGRFGASTLADAACVRFARELGLRWIPAAVGVMVKAIALDLDNTLYAGVLGEDGVDGVVLSEDHARLQAALRHLQANGVLLAVLSRNEPEDVERLFMRRTDFPLRAKHISAFAVSWDSKAEGVVRIANQLRIGADAVLVIDDNLGEIAAIGGALPMVRMLHAARPADTVTALTLYPGLTRWQRGGAEDRLRAEDLKAAERRAALRAEVADPSAYLRSLALRLGFFMNPEPLRGRLHELGAKTNQFATVLARLSEAEVARRLSDPGCATIAASLSDRLSDSGVIAALFGRKDADTLVIDEFCISCRALGRGVEDVIAAVAIRQALDLLGGAGSAPRRVAFVYRGGPRNRPALDWLARFAGVPLAGDVGLVEIPWPPPAAVQALDYPVTVCWE